jgi:transposase IS116/IS110/IS902 family protein
MTRFPTAGHLVSWAGLCPSARQSGIRTQDGKKGQGNAGWPFATGTTAARSEPKSSSSPMVSRSMVPSWLWPRRACRAGGELPAAQAVYLCQDPVLRTGIAAEA